MFSPMATVGLRDFGQVLLCGRNRPIHSMVKVLCLIRYFSLQPPHIHQDTEQLPSVELTGPSAAFQLVRNAKQNTEKQFRAAMLAVFGSVSCTCLTSSSARDWHYARTSNRGEWVHKPRKNNRAFPSTHHETCLPLEFHVAGEVLW